MIIVPGENFAISCAAATGVEWCITTVDRATTNIVSPEVRNTPVGRTYAVGVSVLDGTPDINIERELLFVSIRNTDSSNTQTVSFGKDRKSVV